MTSSTQSNVVMLIRLLRGSRVIREYRIAAEIVTIGSHADCTLKLAGDKSLQPKHVTLYQEDGEVSIVPESGATVLLNGESVDFGLVTAEDTISIGKMNFSVELLVASDSIIPESGRQSVLPKPVTKKDTHKSDANALNIGVETVSMPSIEKSVASSSKPQSTNTAAKEIKDENIEDIVVQPSQSFPTISKTIVKEDLKKNNSLSEQEVQPGKLFVTQDIGLSDASEGPTARVASTVRRPLPSSETTVEDVSENSTTLKVSGISSQLGESTDVKHAVAVEPQSVLKPFEMTGADYFFDDSDDPLDDEYGFHEPFDLATELLKTKPTSSKSKPPLTKGESKREYLCGQVIRVQDDRVYETEFVRRFRSYCAATDNIRCSQKGQNIVVRTEVKNIRQVVKDGKQIQDTLNQSGKQLIALRLTAGDSAVLEGKGGTFRIDVYALVNSQQGESIGINRSVLSLLVGAIVMHATFGLVAWAIIPDRSSVQDDTEEEIFAVVEMEKPEFKKHKDEPTKIKPKPMPKDATAMAERAPRVTTRAIKRIRERASTNTTSTSVSSLLTVLQKGSGKEGKSKNIKDLVSNIDAVGGGAGNAAYNIAGAIASIPGGDVNVARQGGGGNVSTLSGEQVAGRNSKIAQLVKKKPSGKIRGKVTKMSSGARVKGSLSKADVTRVVNSHIHAVQACYEKALLSSPGLSGRIVFDWTVKKDGRVSSVRVRASTIGSAAVSSCISKKIQKWKFPRPKGGEVVITYPFLFRSVSS